MEPLMSSSSRKRAFGDKVRLEPIKVDSSSSDDEEPLMSSSSRNIAAAARDAALALETSEPWFNDAASLSANSSSSKDANEPDSQHQHASATIEWEISVMDSCRDIQDPTCPPAPEHWGPIRRAVWYNNTHTLDLLLSDAYYGSTIDHPALHPGKKCVDTRSALYHAVQYEKSLCVELLLEAKANPHYRACWVSSNTGRLLDDTPLDAARKRKRMLDLFDKFFGCPAPPLPFWRCHPPEMPPPRSLCNL